MPGPDGAAGSGDRSFNVAKRNIHPTEPWIDDAARGPASRNGRVRHAGLGEACETEEAVAHDFG